MPGPLFTHHSTFYHASESVFPVMQLWSSCIAWHCLLQVRSMKDNVGEKAQATPSTAVQMSGLNAVPIAGDDFTVAASLDEVGLYPIALPSSLRSTVLSGSKMPQPTAAALAELCSDSPSLHSWARHNRRCCCNVRICSSVSGLAGCADSFCSFTLQLATMAYG